MSDYKESHFLRLQDYIAEGSNGELTTEEKEYENLLFSVAGVMRKEGRNKARDWLMKDRGCTRFIAERIISEVINLFYATDTIRQDAWRNLLFQKLLDRALEWEASFIVVDDDGKERCTARAKDYEAYTKIIKEAAKIKRLSSGDNENDGGGRVNNTQINIYNTDAQSVGIPETDRRAIINNPYFQQLPKKHQRRLEMEVGVRPIDIDEVMDNSIEIANEVTGE